METRDTEEKPLLSTSRTGKEHFIIDRSQIYIVCSGCVESTSSDFPENPSNRTQDTDEKIDCPPRKVPLFIDPSEKKKLSKHMRGKYDIQSFIKSVQQKQRYSRKRSL